ncbi:MAG: PP2C family protein-serine/threonine phosphatase [Candidatus Kapaibacterium sp.]|jgi:hypothetical protein
MIPIRPSKPTTLYAFIGISIVSIICYFSLQRYWRISPNEPSLKNGYKQTADSLIHKLGIPKDSLIYLYSPIIDQTLTDGLSEKLGTAKAREYLAHQNIATVAYHINVRRRDKRDRSVNFSLGNSSLGERSRSRVERTLLFSALIGMDGTLLEYTCGLPGIDVNADSASAFKQFQTLLPHRIQKHSPHWIRDSIFASDRTMSYWAGLERKQFHRVKAEISLTPPDQADTEKMWHGSWSILYEAGTTQDIGTPTWSLTGILKYICVGIISISLISMIIVFIFQLRNRIVNLWVLLWASVSITCYFVFAQMAVMPALSWLEVILLVFFNFIFLGFLMGAIPLSGLVALAQKTIPEKFYTLLRITERPWQSYYVGRSAIIGITAGIVSTLLSPLTFLMAEKLGIDRLYSSEGFQGGLILMMGNLGFVNVTMLLFIPIVGLVISLPGTTLGLLRFPNRFKYLAAMILTCIYTVSMSSLQGDIGILSYGEAFVGGIITFGTLMIGDLLAVMIAQLISSTLMFYPATQSHESLIYIWVIMWIFFAGVSVLAFIRTPEKVEEEDYKPDYLIRFEDEQRMRDEVAAAKVVQQRLLPSKMPQYPSIDIAAYCLPAFDVGGDYYDFFPLNEHQLGILIADVSGKGMSAAFYITLAKGVIVSQIHESFSPAEVLKRVNRLLFETMERGKFISMIYGVLDIRTMKFTYAQAGHNPIVVRTAFNGTATMLESRGIALGLDKGNVFDKSAKDTMIDLAAGDAIVLYTDGVVEAMNNEKREYGMDNFLSAIQRYAGTAPTLLNAIIQDVKLFIGKAKQHDDITVIVIRRPDTPHTLIP